MEVDPWVWYAHFPHDPDDGIDIVSGCEGDGILVGFGEGPADAWIVDVVNRRVVWFGHCMTAGPIPPQEEGVLPEDWMNGKWESPECCGFHPSDKE